MLRSASCPGAPVGDAGRHGAAVSGGREGGHHPGDRHRAGGGGLGEDRAPHRHAGQYNTPPPPPIE